MSPPPSPQFSSFLVCGEYRIAKEWCTSATEWPSHLLQMAVVHSTADCKLISSAYTRHVPTASAVSPSATCSENLPPDCTSSAAYLFFDVCDHFRADRSVCSLYCQGTVAVTLAYFPVDYYSKFTFGSTNSGFSFYLYAVPASKSGASRTWAGTWNLNV